MKINLFYSVSVCAVLVVTSLNGAVAVAGNDIVMALEEPVNGNTYSGVANVRGWAVAPQGLQKIELYIDNTFQTNIPLGGRRVDVGSAYPTYPGSAQAGFSMAINYSELTAGQHALTVRAIDSYGGAHDVDARFNVTRFDNPYMADQEKVNLDDTNLAREGSTIVIKDVVADGKKYDVKLNWQPATQGFTISQITQQSGDSSGDGGNNTVQGLGVSAEWNGIVITPEYLTVRTVSYQTEACFLHVNVQNKTSNCMAANYTYLAYNNSSVNSISTAIGLHIVAPNSQKGFNIIFPSVSGKCDSISKIKLDGFSAGDIPTFGTSYCPAD